MIYYKNNNFILYHGDTMCLLNQLKQANYQADMIFADPPYELKELSQLPDLILGSGLLKPDGLFILEHGKTNRFEQHPCFEEHRAYGSVNFSFFHAPSLASEEPADGL